MKRWKEKFKYDPLHSLTSTKNDAILYFVRRDLLEEEVEPVEILWKLPKAQKIVNKQQEDGSWKYPGKIREDLRSQEDYDQLETFRHLGVLVEKYGFNNKHHSIQKAADFLFSKQAEEGDFRGIYGNQYAHTYSPAITELLIKAGYVKDSRIEKSFEWLLSTRQDDDGWVIPLRTHSMKYEIALSKLEPLQPNRSKSFSHMVTAMVLRAFAAHPKYCTHEAAQVAGKLVMSRFFENDKYSDRRDKSFWLKFSFPFWFTDLLSALDTLSRLGFTPDQVSIQKALDWFINEQKDDGTWELKLLRSKDKDLQLWIAYVICRTFKRFYD